MQRLQQIVGWQQFETRGQPVRAAGQEITPIGRVRRITWPGGGLIRQRPVAVEVRQGNSTSRLPIHDATRQAIALFITGLVMGALTLPLIRKSFQRSSIR
jgi:hypothetical protein